MKKTAIRPAPDPIDETIATEQPVAPELLKELYLAYLEVRNQRLEVLRADQAATKAEAAHDAMVNYFFSSRRLDPAEWAINYKRGTMVRKSAASE